MRNLDNVNITNNTTNSITNTSSSVDIINNSNKRRKMTTEVTGEIETLQHLVDSKQQNGDVTSIDARNVTFNFGIINFIITITNYTYHFHY